MSEDISLHNIGVPLVSDKYVTSKKSLPDIAPRVDIYSSSSRKIDDKGKTELATIGSRIFTTISYTGAVSMYVGRCARNASDAYHDQGCQVPS